MYQTGSKPKVQGGREITPQEIRGIEETIKECGWLSRTELARTISEHLEWFTASGGYKVDACLKLMKKLEVMGTVKLPAKRQQAIGKQSRVAITEKTKAQSEITGKLSEIKPVWLEAVREKEDVDLWNEYVNRYHYLGYKRPFGYHLRYFIKTGYGILGCALFAGAAKALGKRDQWIGWTDMQRLRNLSWVINSSRFLLFPWVRVSNLASHVLGQLGWRVAEDWEARWGYRPVLMETFVDSRYYRGSSYRAANWQYLGQTTGEGLVRKGKSYSTTVKMIFAKPLADDFRAQLCSDGLTGKVQE